MVEVSEGESAGTNCGGEDEAAVYCIAKLGRYGDMPQPWAKSFYRSKAWRTTRDYIVKRDNHLCQCYKLLGGEPCGEPAEEVHHIEELTPYNIDNLRIALGEDNLISLSFAHHHQIHNGSDDCGDEFEFDDSGMLVRRGNNRY